MYMCSSIECIEWWVSVYLTEYWQCIVFRIAKIYELIYAYKWALYWSRTLCIFDNNVIGFIDPNKVWNDNRDQSQHIECYLWSCGVDARDNCGEPGNSINTTAATSRDERGKLESVTNTTQPSPIPRSHHQIPSSHHVRRSSLSWIQFVTIRTEFICLFLCSIVM